MAKSRSNEKLTFGETLLREFSYAIADIRHKWEEAAYGRTVTPRWQEQVPDRGGGIHGTPETPRVDNAPADIGGGVHGNPEIDPQGGGAPAKQGPTGPVHPYTPPAELSAGEPQGLGMSYAELTKGWEQACLPNPDRPEPPKPPEPAIDR